jgi:uncharacterized protein (DUF2141 family)
MVKKAVLLLGILFMMAVFAYAEEKFTITGQVIFSGQEDIYLGIYTIENFPQYKKTLPPEPFIKKIKPSPEQIKAGRLSFTFSEVPKGKYCIIAFQDVDNNGRLTCNTWGGIEEVMCFYKESPTADFFSATNWNDVKFELDKDISGIGMKLD